MASFFIGPIDLGSWIRSKANADEAANVLTEITRGEDQQSIVDGCRAIYPKPNYETEKDLFVILQKYKLTGTKLSEAKL